MRYRVLRGGPAARFAFDRAAAAPAVPASLPLPPKAAELANPYYRCYGTARRKEELISTQGLVNN